MCQLESSHKRKFLFSYNWWLLTALIAGVIAGSLGLHPLHLVANAISEVVIRALKLISLPMLFLSIVATISGMKNGGEVRRIGRGVLFYTLITTGGAALLGLGLFQLIGPVGEMPISESGSPSRPLGSYWSALLNLVPSNAVQAFLDNHVIGVMVMALTLGAAILTLQGSPRAVVTDLFAGLFGAILKITRWLIAIMPLGVFAFVTLFTETLMQESWVKLNSFLLYLLCVVLANLIQAFFVLPALLKLKGISPFQLGRAMASALTLAFFTRSSNATLPVTIQCAEEKAKISPRVSRFSLPLLATINMNGCAAFILITVLYVGGCHGIVFGPFEMLLMVVVATLAAIGNAGVAMGCFFLSSALLAAMNIPLTLMGMILPVYAFIDMLETSVNVWSDACVTAIVEKDLKRREAGVISIAVEPTP